MVDIVIAKATGSPWSEVLGHPEGHLNGQDRRTFGPWHLSLGANIGFAFEFLRRTDRENRGDPLRPEIAASRRVRGADVRPCLFPLFVYPGTGKGGAQRVRTHNPRVSLQNSQPGQGHFGGRLWPARRARPLAYFRAPALSQARTGSHPS